ncbi:hypothetical protein D8B26_000041 [Coccidioides posadasii str. Silveira]|uniref:Glyoxalase-like domain-containing protein n=1 Tax=Coccidioides posadasii (strain RMSCC 757 / Silveira) TaxID=443226 RepID=E9D7E4_COCPS|nr:conserved hypothetical protein [Coccidioides posadasii str. Silveira]QVM05331.1 hypothetical protein D8B26_000041 [Coccidioides posadasii str. Silveira]
MGSITASRIDHITIILSEEEFETLPPWLSENFTIIEGGKHTGQASQLKLIIFEDGTYLELFNWWGPPPSNHSWGRKEPGLIDWSISCTSAQSRDEHYHGIDMRVNKSQDGDGGLGVRYPIPTSQGRTTPEGKKFHWTRANPEFHDTANTPDAGKFFRTGRLDAPFLCYDGTPRETRLRFGDPSRTTHPCGATGVDQIEVLVPSSHEANYLKLLANFTATQPGTSESGIGSVFKLGLPVEGEGSECTVWVHGERGAEDKQWLASRGIGPIKLKLRAKGREGHGEEVLGSEGSASHVSLIW